MDNVLVLVRHGESEWNKLNLFTGWKDPDLTEKGMAEARAAGRMLKAKGYRVRRRLHERPEARPAHARHSCSRSSARPGSRPTRTRRSTSATTATSPASTRTKRARSGARTRCTSGGAATTSRPPAARASRTPPTACCPTTRPRSGREVKAGRNVLVAAHGNSLRALIMKLEGLTGEEIVARELATGVPIVYRLTPDGTHARAGTILLPKSVA